MTNEEILKKAIEKAVEGGLEKNHQVNMLLENIRCLGKMVISQKWYYYVIFSHDFAKAFWGEEINVYPVFVDLKDYKYQEGCECRTATITQTKSAYEYHLQQMVLEKDPIKYLETFL